MKTLMLAGGGTGGHIYPAVAVAQAFKKKYPDSTVIFVGTPRGLETKIIPREGFPLELIRIGALNNVSLLTKMTTVLSMPLALLHAFWVVLKYRPDYVVGVGGYASGPVMFAARLLFRKTFLFEPNAYPGLTNRWLSWAIEKAFVNFKETGKFFRSHQVVGIPVRQDLQFVEKSPGEKLKVLIFGGSQGARGINNTVIEALKLGGSWLEKVEIVHQTGSADFKRLELEYKKLNLPNAQVFEFLYDMPKRYAWADLVVSRAGASTLAELAVMHKAAILVPFPFAADNHQHKNALALASKNAAILVPQSEFSPEKFISLISDFEADPKKLDPLEQSVSQFYVPESAASLVNSLN